MKLYVLIAVLFLLSIACVAVPVMATGGQIVYMTGDGIFRWTPDGVTPITLDQHASGLTLSQDGTKIVYHGIITSNDEGIYVRDVLSGEETRIYSGASDIDFAWSPDGKKIAFAAPDTNNKNKIFTMNADGSNVVQLTYGDNSDFYPDWSPDGKRIAFTSRYYIDPNKAADWDYEIYEVNVDGSYKTNITNDFDSWDRYPDWSPDGTKIVYTSMNANGFNIYVMNADGSGKTDLTNVKETGLFAFTQYPRWSPDGSQIAFWGENGPCPGPHTGNYGDLYVMDANGGNIACLVNNDNDYVHINWAVMPDTDPPEIISTDPANNGLQVPVDLGAITIHFNEPVKWLPHGDNSVHIYDTDWNEIPVGTVSVDPVHAPSDLVIHAPSMPYPWFEHWVGQKGIYTVEISGVQDLGGNVMVPYSFNFHTVPVDTTPPSVTSTSPAGGADNVPPDVTITATLDEEINACVGSAILKDSHNNPVTLTYPNGPSPHGFSTIDHRTMTIGPVHPDLVDGETYTVTLSGLVDGYNNVMPDYSWSFTVRSDTDNDGLSDSQEMGPAGTDSNYDGNGDGIADRKQGNVASFSSSTGVYTTLASSGGTALAHVIPVANPSPSDAPASVQWPIGFIDYTITGVTPGGPATVILYLPTTMTVNTYWKYGKTPDNPTPHWYEFLFDGTTGAEIKGNVITLHFVDGKRGDDDISANGQIVEPGGPGMADKTPPVVTITIPKDGAEYAIGQSVKADYSATDAGSGIASVTGTVPAGSTMNTATPGTFSFTVTATDKAGNSATKTNTYTVYVPVKATILPKTINLAGNGAFIAVVKLPAGYPAANADKATVQCNGAIAKRVITTKLLPQYLLAIFKTSELKGTSQGDKITLTVSGMLKGNLKFEGSDTVKIIQKGGMKTDEILDWTTPNDAALLKNYNVGA